MSETKIWLRRPRYSLLDLTAFLLFFAVTIAAGMFWRFNNLPNGLLDQMEAIKRAAFASPLRNVVVATTSPGLRPDAYRGQYEFSEIWFMRHIPVWQRVMEPYKGRPGVSYLEIGVYEGGAVVWMLEHILTDPGARVTGIDIFEGPYKDVYFRNIERSGSADKVTTLTGYSQVVLRGLPLESFDIIYVDGSHVTADALEDAVLSWRLLKVGGLLIFDDYQFAGPATYNKDEPFGFPKPAIDAFVQCFQDRCEVIHNEYQLIIRKTRE